MTFKLGDKVVPNPEKRRWDGVFYGVDAWHDTDLVWFAAGDFGFIIEDVTLGTQFMDVVFVLDVCAGREIAVYCDDLVLAEIQ